MERNVLLAHIARISLELKAIGFEGIALHLYPTMKMHRIICIADILGLDDRTAHARFTFYTGGHATVDDRTGDRFFDMDVARMVWGGGLSAGHAIARMDAYCVHLKAYAAASTELARNTIGKAWHPS